MGNWPLLPKDIAGAPALRKRLSKLLHQKVLESYAGVKTQINDQLKATKGLREKIGDARLSIGEQKALLSGCGQQFYDKTSKAAQGYYHLDGDFFYPPLEAQEEDQNADIAPRRLRAFVDYLHKDFARIVWERGHYWEVYDGAERAPLRNTNGPLLISKDAFLKNITECGSKNSSIEVPTGEFSHSATVKLFKQQCSPWKQIADQYLEDVVNTVRDYLDIVTQDITGSDGTLRDSLYEFLVNDKLEETVACMKRKLDEVHKPVKKGLMRTYDLSFHKQRSDQKDVRVEQAHQRLLGREIGGRIFQSAGTSNKPFESQGTKDSHQMSKIVTSNVYDSIQSHYEVSKPSRRVIFTLNHAPPLTFDSMHEHNSLITSPTWSSKAFCLITYLRCSRPKL